MAKTLQTQVVEITIPIVLVLQTITSYEDRAKALRCATDDLKCVLKGSGWECAGKAELRILT